MTSQPYPALDTFVSKDRHSRRYITRKLDGLPLLEFVRIEAHDAEAELRLTRLLTAAPDLLTAIHVIIEARDYAALADDPAYHWIDQAINAARSVVAKVEGQA